MPYSDKALMIASQVEQWLVAHILTWGFSVQLALAVGAAIVAYFGHKMIRPRLSRRSEDSTSVSIIRRFTNAAANLVGLGIFAALLVIALVALRESLPELHTGLLYVAINLSVAWALIRLLSSAITNPQLASVVVWIAWLIAAMNVVGILRPLADMLDGVAIPLGASRITLLAVVNGILLLALLLWTASFVAAHAEQRLAASTVTPRMRILIGKILNFVLIAFSCVVVLSSIGINLSALAVFAGAVGVGIGIGLQHQVSNLISGLFLLLDKSVKPGDVIEVGDAYGWVREMRARYVGVITRDNKEILIPNDDFVLNQVINWSHSEKSLRLEVKFGVSYDADPHHVRGLAVGAAIKPVRVIKQPPPVCHLAEFGDSSINFVLRFWIDDPEAGLTNIKGEVLLNLWDTFKESGIGIPFPHRYVIMAGSRKDADKTGPEPANNPDDKRP